MKAERDSSVRRGRWRLVVPVALIVAAVAAAQAQQTMPGMPGMAPGSTAMPDPPAALRPAAANPPADRGNNATGAAGVTAPDATSVPVASAPMPMAMSDNTAVHQVLLDQFEYVNSRDGNGLAWDAQAWYGRDDGKLWLKTEGERRGGKTKDGRFEALWSKPIAAFWDVQAGLRHDFGDGPRRNWLAFGVQGLAPYWFDIEATAYLGNEGRTAARLKTEYQAALGQRLFLVPRLEGNFYGRSDPQQRIGSGLSDVVMGLRLRYEMAREFAPYIGVSWGRKTGQTADMARQASEPVSERRIVAGVRVWF